MLAIQRNAQTVRIRLPRNASGNLLGGAALGLVFAAVGAAIIWFVAVPQWRSAGHGGSMAAFLVLFALAFTIIPGAFLLIGVALVGACILAFIAGRIVTVSSRQIGTAFGIGGPFSIGRARPLDDFSELEVSEKPGRRADVIARFSTGRPLVLARSISIDAAAELSEAIRTALADVADRRRVAIRKTESADPAAMVAAVDAGTQRATRTPARTKIVRSAPQTGIVRFTVPPATWLAVIPPIFILATFMAAIIGAIQPHLTHAWGTREFVAISMLMALIIMITIAFGTRKQVTLEAGRGGLAHRWQSLLSRGEQRWATSEIERLEITLSLSTKEDSSEPSQRWISVVPVSGKPVKLLSCSYEELRWMVEELSAALGPASSAARAAITGKFVPERRPVSTKSTRIGGGLFIAIATIAIAAITFASLRQDRRLRHAKPMMATILTSSTRESGGEDSHTEAVISYRYVVDGKNYTSDEIYAGMGDDQSTGLALQQLLKPGDRQAGWYVDDHPNQAFLLRVRSPIYAFLTIFFAVFFAAGMAVAFSQPGDAGTNRLSPEAGGLVSISFIVIGTAALAQYQFGGEATWPTLLRITGAVWAMIVTGIVIGQSIAFLKRRALV